MSSNDWRADLSGAIARGLADEGFTAVSAELVAQYDVLAEHPDAPVEPLRPDAPVLGLVDCEAGRLGVLLDPTGRVSVHLGRTTATVVAQVQETTQVALVVFTGAIEDEATTWEGSAAEAVAPYDGAEEVPARREQLRKAGLRVPGWFSGSGFTETELLDACGAVVVAVRGHTR